MVDITIYTLDNKRDVITLEHKVGEGYLLHPRKIPTKIPGRPSGSIKITKKQYSSLLSKSKNKHDPVRKNRRMINTLLTYSQFWSQYK